MICKITNSYLIFFTGKKFVKFVKILRVKKIREIRILDLWFEPYTPFDRKPV